MPKNEQRLNNCSQSLRKTAIIEKTFSAKRLLFEYFPHEKQKHRVETCMRLKFHSNIGTKRVLVTSNKQTF